jgi:hypothetical protein
MQATAMPRAFAHFIARLELFRTIKFQPNDPRPSCWHYRSIDRGQSNGVVRMKNCHFRSRSMWKGRALIAAAVAAAIAGPAYAVELDCEKVDARDAGTVEYGRKTLKKLKTGVDTDVKSACTPWEGALNYWKYGDYYPLWEINPLKVSEKDKNQFITTHDQYNIHRMQCTQRVERGKPPVVGYFAYHFVAAERPKDNESRGTATLDLLCTTSKGREKGVGTTMLDEAAKEISGTFLPDQFFRLELVAVKGAEPFYNRFELSCDDYDAGKKYSTRLTLGQKKGEAPGCASRPPITQTRLRGSVIRSLSDASPATPIDRRSRTRS